MNKYLPRFLPTTSVVAVVLTLASSTAMADKVDAERILKAMSDYMASEQTFAFDYDSTLEVVTTENQKLGIAVSGTVALARPDQFRATRTGGFADIELIYDGEVATLVGKQENLFAQTSKDGTIDDLIEIFRAEHGIIFPGADLLSANPYELLMSDVTDVKDLGSGVIGGRECDHLAFRASQVDWQIWIAQGDKPYPCRYAITTPTLAQGPQLQIDIRDWRGGMAVTDDMFSFSVPEGATEVTIDDLEDTARDFPDHFDIGATQ